MSQTTSTLLREDMLRELNLHPLWQLRSSPARVISPTLTPTPIAMLPVAEVVAPTPLSAVSTVKVQEDINSLTWPQLAKRVQGCTACNLRAGCLQTVFGTGDKNADWLFVGSWPSEDDEARGEPFAGQAGQLLDNMLAAIQLKRDANVFLANVVKCSGSIVRGPQAEEIAQCAPYLARQIQLLQPKIIVALGHAAATVLVGKDMPWDKLINQVHAYTAYAEDTTQPAIPLIITHHPAALLLTPLNKAQAWRDLCLARDTVRSMA